MLLVLFGLLPTCAFATPQPVGIANGGAILLWNNSDGNGAVDLWTSLNNTADLSVHHTYGPYPGWNATAVAAGPDRLARILWTNTDGTVSLWRADINGGSFTQNAYGPYPGWVAAGLTVGGDNTPRILWNHPADGAMSLWRVAPDGSFTQGTYGPYAGWSAKLVAAGDDSIPRVLWLNTNGTVSLWDNVVDAPGFSQASYGPYPGWSPLSMAADGNSIVRLLWNNPSNSTTSLWNAPHGGGFTQQTYTNPAGYSPVGVTTYPGSAGYAQILYAQPNGSSLVRGLSPSGSVIQDYAVAPPGASTGGGGGGGGTTTPATPNPHGHYSVIYSGGNLTSSDPSATASYSTGSSSNYGDTSYSGSISGTGYNTGGAGISVRLSGGVRAKFTWQADPAYPGSPAPAQVTVIERCTSSWSINGYADGVSGQSATGFGQQNGPTSASGGATSGSVSGIGSASGGGAEFTIQCSPTALVSGGQGDSYICSRGTVSFDYTATPVMMSLAGTTFNTLDKKDTMLIGQQCTASLSGLPAVFAPGGSLQNNVSYSWAVSGTAFHEWRQTTPQVGNNFPNPNASFYDPITGQPSLPTPNQLTLPTPQWHWNDPMANGEKVTCTATLTPPSGQGSAITITVSPQTVNVQVPAFSASNTVGKGYVGPYNDSTTLSLYVGPTPPLIADKKMQGSTWRTSVTMPASPNYSGAGYFGYAQLATPGEYVTINGVEISSDATDEGEGLDNIFPYQLTNIPARFTADSTPYDSGDSPALSLNASFSAVRLRDSFKVYLMFMPPGTGSNWVPLAEGEWATYASSANPPDLTSGLKANKPDGTNWVINPSSQNVYIKYQFRPWQIHPKWTIVHPAGAPFAKQ